MLARLLLLISLLLIPSASFADELRYYMLTVTPSTAVDLLSLEQDNKESAFKGNTLSAVFNDDSTQVLVKVPNADSALRAFISANFTVLRIYTRSTHAELVTLFNSDLNWSDTRKEAE